jgi:hypothetical protein
MGDQRMGPYLRVPGRALPEAVRRGPAGSGDAGDHAADPVVSLLIDAAIAHTKAELELLDTARTASPASPPTRIGYSRT